MLYMWIYMAFIDVLKYTLINKYPVVAVTFYESSPFMIDKVCWLDLKYSSEVCKPLFSLCY